MCTTQPVFQVTVNNQLTYLCGKCIADHSFHSTVKVQGDKPIVGKTCQCSKCK